MTSGKHMMAVLEAMRGTGSWDKATMDRVVEVTSTFAEFFDRQRSANDRAPKHGDLWFLPKQSPDHDSDEEACFWNIVRVFETVVIYDEIDWPPPYFELFHAPTKPIACRRAYLHNKDRTPDMPPHAVLVWRDNMGISTMDAQLTLGAEDARHLHATLFAAADDPKLTGDHRRTLARLIRDLQEQVARL